MHSTLPTHVLALAPNSLASLGELDGDSLSELWAVFTRCKDSLQNGRRLENLSWRLWFDSGRRDPKLFPRDDSACACDHPPEATGMVDEEIRQKIADEGWSDPEWEETSDSDSEEETVPTTGDEREQQRTGRSTTATEPTRTRTASVPAPPPPSAATATRPALGTRGLSREWRSAPTISGGSLQRMITDSSILPAISLPPKACSVTGVPAASSPEPSLGSRGSSAPDRLNSANTLRLQPLDPTTPESDYSTTTMCPPTKAAAPADPTTPCSRPPPPTGSPAMSRSASSPAHSTAAAAVSTPAPTTAHAPLPAPAQTAVVRPSSSGKLAHAPSLRKKSISASGSQPMAVPAPLVRAPSEIHLQRNLSNVELAQSFKPQSFVKGFDVSSSFEAPRPRPGSIAPPPTPAGVNATLAPSPPRPETAAPSASSPAQKNPAPAATQPGPSALSMQPKPIGTGKKIFFISSPNSESDEDHSAHSREKAHVHSSPPRPERVSTLQQSMQPPSAKENGKGKGKEQAAEDEDEDDWDEEESEDDDDASSGWGSEYSTDSDVARNSTANGPQRPGANRSKTSIDPQLFAKRPPSTLHMSPSMSAMGGPGELKRRPPGLLSQLFHPDQFLDDSDRSHSALEMRRGHKSMSSLPTLTQLHPSKSTGLLSGGTMARRTKSFLKGKPDDVELESSSDEEDQGGDGDDKENSSDYEDVDEEAVAAAALRRQRLAELEQAAAMAAPPQTPRTTRRAMLATELSESLRRNLLWERQTRNRVMGGAPRPPVVPGQPLPQRPSSTRLASPPSAVPLSDTVAAAPTAPVRRAGFAAKDDGLRAPHPSPVTRISSPAVVANAMTRGHTVADFRAQTRKLAQGRKAETDSSTSVTSDEDDVGLSSATEITRVW
ncbi:hypothetical protein JCM21900_006965 [Sporobolomyces salmonicolor]